MYYEKEIAPAGEERIMEYVYYYRMEGSRYLLADERNKKHLLDLLLGMQVSERWPVYAFCVTDDSAYIVTETTDRMALETAMQWESGQFLESYEGFPDKYGERYLRPCTPERVESAPELARRCRAIHRLPQRLGYVSRPGDYWWSSYRTYMGGYLWPGVDCSVLLNYFSSDPERALWKLRLYHSDSRVGRPCGCQTDAESDPGENKLLRMQRKKSGVLKQSGRTACVR